MGVHLPDEFTMRDAFACHALMGMYKGSGIHDEIAIQCYQQADAMLRRRCHERTAESLLGDPELVKFEMPANQLKDAILVDPVEPCSGTCGVAIAGVNPDSVHLLVNALLGFIDWADRQVDLAQSPPEELFREAEQAIAASRKGV